MSLFKVMPCTEQPVYSWQICPSELVSDITVVTEVFFVLFYFLPLCEGNDHRDLSDGSHWQTAGRLAVSLVIVITKGKCAKSHVIKKTRATFSKKCRYLHISS